MKRLFSLVVVFCLTLSLFCGLLPGAAAADTLTYDEILGAATVVKLNMDKNILPNTIPAGSTSITPAQFEYLACQVVIAINGGTTSGTLTVAAMEEAPRTMAENSRNG